MIVVVMLLTISLVSATDTNIKLINKESPLYKLRTRSAIKQKIGDMLYNIKAKFLGGKNFFIPGLQPDTQEVIILRSWTQLKFGCTLGACTAIPGKPSFCVFCK